MNTIELLDQLAEYESQRDILEMDRKRLVAEATPAEVTARIADINVEFAVKENTVAANIANLRAEIEAAVLSAEATAKGAHYMAIYTKGRVTWDGKKLDGMMSIIPALKDARKEGEPSVSFRKA